MKKEIIMHNYGHRKTQGKASEVEKQKQLEREQDELKEKQIDALKYAIRSTYGASAVDYATNIKNASTAEIGIANAIKRRGLSRGDSFDSPNDAAIQKITEMINTSGSGVNINPTADALWEIYARHRFLPRRYR